MISVKNNLKLDNLSKFKITLPENVGESWRGIEHEEMAKAMWKGMTKSGYTVYEDRYAISANGANLAASYVIKTPGKKVPEGYRLSIGVITNNERRKALSFYMGVVHQKMNTGIVLGLVDEGKRNTVGLTPDLVVESTLDSYESQIGKVSEILECYEQNQLSTKESDHLIANACRLTIYKGRFPWSKVGLVDQAYQRIIRQKKSERLNSRNSLNLLLAFGEACKTVPPLKQMEEMNAFRDLVPMADFADFKDS